MTKRAPPVVLAAPSGTGKTTLARRLVGGEGSFVFSTSATTRRPRPGERDGVDYHFLTGRVFRGRVEEGAFLEWANVHGCLYGTPRSEVEKAADRGEHVVLDIDVQGARQIKEAIPDAVLIFVLPPSVDVMLARLTGRGTEPPHHVATRLRSALDELQTVPDFDYVVVNDDLEECLSEIRNIVSGSGASTEEVSVDAESLRAEIAEVLSQEYAEYLREEADDR